MRILYLEDNGIVTIMYPSDTINPATGNPWTVEEVAQKDVPKGKKYKIRTGKPKSVILKKGGKFRSKGNRRSRNKRINFSGRRRY